VLLAAGHARGQAPRDKAPTAAAIVDVTAFDREGRFVEDLRSADFTVTVDGVAKPVLWVRRVSRGPGAAGDAATRRAASAEDGLFGAEGERTVFVVIDEASIGRGDEKAVVQAVGTFLDRLGLDDPVAVLRLPLSSDVTVTLSKERAEVRLALSQVAGRRVAPAEVLPAATPQPAPADGDQLTDLNPDKQPRPDLRAEAAAPRPAIDSARALAAIFETLRPLPGRKIVAVFSAGLSPDAGRTAEEAAQAAALARATVYAFGVRSVAADPGELTSGPLERLALFTGGAYVAVGKNPERTIERAVRELSACYVLGLDASVPTMRSTRRTLKIDIAKKGLTLRSPAWLVPLEDAADRPAVAAPVVEPPPVASSSLAALTPTPSRPPSKNDPELNEALARLFAYADSYERQYSMLVAEEDYKQRAPKGSVHLRSDFLLVRPAPNDDWISFRDVFEVDGQPVRDREDRLRRLFIEATPEALARMDAIRDEGSRYNIGIVGRTVNVPLLPLTFLRRENRGRFDYRLDGRSEAAGVEVVKIRYTEWARPTLVSDGHMGDQPVSGWYLVDAITGAIVETRMEARSGDARGLLVVRYRRDQTLGLWVPGEMTELYTVPEASGMRGAIVQSTIEGKATYSNFRRFQVKTEEKIATPK
jgi:VWFA-related protein